MVELIKNIKSVIKNNCVLVIFGLAIFEIGTIVGFFALTDSIKEIYYKHVVNFYSLALSNTPFKFLFIRIGNLILLFIPIILLSLNNKTTYLSFIFIFYKGLILSISFKCFFVVFSFNGLIIFLFLCLIQSITSMLSILLFILLSATNKCKNMQKFINNTIKITLISIIIALIGIFLEFLLLITILRPFNFYF